MQLEEKDKKNYLIHAAEVGFLISFTNCQKKKKKKKKKKTLISWNKSHVFSNIKDWTTKQILNVKNF